MNEQTGGAIDTSLCLEDGCWLFETTDDLSLDMVNFNGVTWDITHSIWLREAVVTLSQADFDALDDETANQLTLIYAKAERLEDDGNFYVGDASYRMVLDPRQYTNRLMIQYRDDPCRDECNTDENC